MQLSRNAVLALVTITLVLTSASMTAFSLFLPFIEREFDWSRAMVTLPYTLAMVAWGISSPIFGKLADDRGARPVILGGIVLMATGFLVMGLAQTLWQLCLAFGLLIGTAMGAASITIGSLLVAKHFDARRRAWAVSIVQSASPLYPLLFAPLLFLLVKLFGWRTAALATSAQLWLIALPLAWFSARDPDRARLATHRRASWSASVPYLRNRSMVAMFVARLSCGLAFFQTAHLVALTMSKGFDPVVGTTALSIYGAAAVGWSLVFGWLADRHSRARILSLSYLVRGLGTLALATAIPNQWVLYLLVIVAIGPTFGTIGVQNVLFYEAVGPRLAGMMLGLSFIVHQLGSSLGPQLGSIVFDLTQTYDGYQLAIGLVLLASAAITFNITDLGPRPAQPAMAATPSSA